MGGLLPAERLKITFVRFLSPHFFYASSTRHAHPGQASSAILLSRASFEPMVAPQAVFKNDLADRFGRLLDSRRLFIAN